MLIGSMATFWTAPAAVLSAAAVIALLLVGVAVLWRDVAVLD